MEAIMLTVFILLVVWYSIAVIHWNCSGSRFRFAAIAIVSGCIAIAAVASHEWSLAFLTTIFMLVGTFNYVVTTEPTEEEK